MTIRGTLYDLDELSLRCRDEASRSFISEAIKCFKSEAYRSCIVSTWTALVYDYLHKLRELDRLGDSKAHAVLAGFEDSRKRKDVAQLLKFEREFPEQAQKQFELISATELIDIQRIIEDRNRCAHPSLNVEDVVYYPPAELARTHIVNAIQYLLCHPPVQGKAALQGIMTEIRSETFPIAPDKAAAYLRVGPLARPKESLIRNLVILLLKNLTDLKTEGDLYQRLVAGLLGTLRLHPTAAKESLLSSITAALSTIPSASFERAVQLLYRLPAAWEGLRDDQRLRVSEYIGTFNVIVNPGIVSTVLDCAPLRAMGLERLGRLGNEELASVIGSGPRHEFVARAVALYGASTGWSEANDRFPLVTMLAKVLTRDDVIAILACMGSNRGIRDSNVRWRVYWAIREQEIIPPSDWKGLMAAQGLDADYARYLKKYVEPAEPDEV